MTKDESTNVERKPKRLTDEEFSSLKNIWNMKSKLLQTVGELYLEREGVLQESQKLQESIKKINDAMAELKDQYRDLVPEEDKLVAQLTKTYGEIHVNPNTGEIVSNTPE